MIVEFEKTAEGWRLSPTAITIRNEGGLWTIYVVDRPLMPGNYSNDYAAKREAWQFAYKNRKSILGTYRLTLKGEL